MTIRIIREHLKKYRGRVTVVLVFIFALMLLELSIPIIFKQFVDALVEGDSGNRAEYLGTLVVLLAAIGGIRLARWVSEAIAGYTWQLMLPHLWKDLTDSCFKYLHKHSFQFFTNSFTGSLVRKVSRFVDSVYNLLDSTLWQIVPFVLEPIGILIVLYFVNPWVALAMFVWSLAFMTITYKFSRYKMVYDEKESKINTKVSGRLADTITNNLAIKAFANYSFEVAGFLGLTSKQRDAQRKSRLLSEHFDAIHQGLFLIVEIGLLSIATYFWAQNLLSAGDFVLIQSYIFSMFFQLSRLGRTIERSYQSLAYAKEMVEILDTPHEVKDKRKAKDLEVTQGGVEFKDVVFNYNETRTVIKKLNLSIKPGEKVGLVGPSGAGKSTITSLMLRYYDLTGGAIKIDGQNIADVTQESLRAKIGLVPQDTVLFHRSLMENIRYGRLDATDEEVIAAAELARAHDFIMNTPKQYKTLVGERGVKLSGGERQRIAIARALLKDAPIVILDEATSSLDSESESAIQKSLETLMQNKTTLVIAHRLSTIKKMDRIVVLQSGQVVEEGTHDELVAQKGIYHDLWEHQVGGFIVEP